MATIFSFGVNDEEEEGVLDENSESTEQLAPTDRDFLDAAIRDYNQVFKTNYDTSADKFQNYYKDVSLRMKNRKIDLLIVVNMFLTGFDATTLNTLWVDKNLRLHGLLHAYCRTNRILYSVNKCRCNFIGSFVLMGILNICPINSLVSGANGFEPTSSQKRGALSITIW